MPNAGVQNFTSTVTERPALEVASQGGTNLSILRGRGGREEMTKFKKGAEPGDYIHQKIWEKFNSFPNRDDGMRYVSVRHLKNYEDLRSAILSSQFSKTVAWYKRPKGYMALYEYASCLVMFDVLGCECGPPCDHPMRWFCVGVAGKNEVSVKRVFDFMNRFLFVDEQLVLFEEF
jgi:hypothetical protein